MVRPIRGGARQLVFEEDGGVLVVSHGWVGFHGGSCAICNVNLAVGHDGGLLCEMHMRAGEICDRQSIVYVMTSLSWTWINDVLRMHKHCLIHILDPSYNCCFNLYVFIINYKSLTFFYFIFYF